MGDTVKRIIADLNRERGPILGENSRRFLERVYDTPTRVYRDRLQAMGLTGCKRVLDAGCGFGQWTLALAETSGHVAAVDISAERLIFLRRFVDELEIENVSVNRARLEHLGFANESFDAVFCYSAISYTPWKESLAELARVLASGGRLYVTAHGLGWFLHLWKNQPNAADDYDPRDWAARGLLSTVCYARSGQPPEAGEILIEPDEMAAAMEHVGLVVEAQGPEGTIHLDPGTPEPTPFFQGRYFGETGVYEVLAVKRT